MAISGRHPRSVPAAVKTVLAPRLVIARRPEADVAISGRHCRSERAIVKTACTPDLSLRGAKRRGNLGKALPFGTSHRKNGTHLRFVIARSEATWQSREGTPDLYRPPLKQCWPPRLVIARRPEADVAISGRHCRSERAIVKTVRTPDLSLRGAKRRGNLGKALPFSTSHRKTACTPDLSLRGAKRRGNLGKAPPIRTGRR